MSLHYFLLYHLRRHVKISGFMLHHRFQTTQNLRLRAFVCNSVFGTRDEALILVFDIWHETICLMFDIIRNVSAPGTHIGKNWAGTGVPSSWAWVFPSSVPVFVRGELNNLKPLLKLKGHNSLFCIEDKCSATQSCAWKIQLQPP